MKTQRNTFKTAGTQRTADYYRKEIAKYEKHPTMAHKPHYENCKKILSEMTKIETEKKNKEIETEMNKEIETNMEMVEYEVVFADNTTKQKTTEKTDDTVDTAINMLTEMMAEMYDESPYDYMPWGFHPYGKLRWHYAVGAYNRHTIVQYATETDYYDLDSDYVSQLWSYMLDQAMDRFKMMREEVE